MRVNLTCKGRRRVCRRGDGVETGVELTFRRPDGATWLECPIEEMSVTYSGPAGLRLAGLYEDGQSYPWTCEDSPALEVTTDEPPDSRRDFLEGGPPTLPAALAFDPTAAPRAPFNRPGHWASCDVDHPEGAGCWVVGGCDAPQSIARGKVPPTTPEGRAAIAARLGR